MLMIKPQHLDLTELGACEHESDRRSGFRRYQIERGPRVKRHLRSSLPCRRVSTYHSS